MAYAVASEVLSRASAIAKDARVAAARRRGYAPPCADFDVGCYRQPALTAGPAAPARASRVSARQVASARSPLHPAAENGRRGAAGGEPVGDDEEAAGGRDGDDSGSGGGGGCDGGGGAEGLHAPLIAPRSPPGFSAEDAAADQGERGGSIIIATSSLDDEVDDEVSGLLI